MGTVGTWHQSVWELKRFTKMTDSHPVQALNVDYGFMNCATSWEYTRLRQIYTEYSP
jgi:hypothetical protein